MTNNLKASMCGDTLTVTTGVSLTLSKGDDIVDRKTDEILTFQGKVDRPNLKCPFMFLDGDLQTRRHSAKYIAKYMA